MERCLICGLSFIHVMKHVVVKHGISRERYFVEFINHGQIPKCKCGCGQDVEICFASKTRFKIFVDRSHENKYKKIRRKPKKKRSRKNTPSIRRRCVLCKRSFGHLARHVRSTHGLDWIEYQIKYDHNGRWPLCECGCEEKTTIRRSGHINRYIKGHESRGRTLSNEHKQKLRVASSERLRQRWIDNRKTMKKIAMRGTKTIEERWTKEEWSEKISKAITKKYISGSFGWSRGEHLSQKTGRTQVYRSSWELQYMKKLDVDDFIVDWEYESFAIPYEREGTIHRYIPDFLITFNDGRKEIHEVGVRDLKEGPLSQKTSAGRQFANENGMIYRIIDMTEGSDE